MPRRYFEHVYNEICVAAKRRVSRYTLWLLVWESGGDPDHLTSEQARTFVDSHLSALLSEEGIRLEGRPRRRLEKSILRFNSRHPTPEELFSF
jgi:hypothetical protein